MTGEDAAFVVLTERRGAGQHLVLLPGSARAAAEQLVEASQQAELALAGDHEVACRVHESACVVSLQEEHAPRSTSDP